MAWFLLRDDELTLRLHVHPGSRTNKIDGIFTDKLKVRIKAPPVDGKANIYLINYFARQFNVPGSKIEITRGKQSKTKTIVISHPKVYPDWFDELS